MRFFSIIAYTTALLSNFANAINTPTAADMETMSTRRTANIINKSVATTADFDDWVTNINATGNWDDVDYTSGCGARISNWPATEHLRRTRTLASTYISNSTSDSALFDKVTLAFNYWLSNDWSASDCLDNGGVAELNCPCGTPGLWSKNWFNQLISVPQTLGEICLLLKDTLTTSQQQSCTTIQARAFARVQSQIGTMKRSVGTLTGANLLDVSSVGITMGLVNDDSDILKQALDAFYGGVFVNLVTAGDGIQSDGSFMQHDGILYNGNYGKDYIDDLLSVFVETKETALAPDEDSQEAFETLMSGTEWMIVADSKIQLLLWQYSVIGRMISYKYSDEQASGGVSIDFDKVEEGTEGWAVEDKLDAITNRLQEPHTRDANQGDLVGTRYFYNSDYMVHRAPNYVTTMKMYSSRTINSECLNVQNPFGFHLSDGAIHNYLTGDEYVDTFAIWNWDLVPGITVDLEGTPLKCSTVKQKGRKPFVGGATDSNTGIAVMEYENPINKNLNFKKTVFFFPSGYAIQVGPVTSKNTTAQLATVLDQRKLNGNIYVSGELANTNTSYTTVATKSIWHDQIGYYFPTPEVLSVDSTRRTGNWSDIGISGGKVTKQLWTSYIKHSQTNTTGLLTQYIVQPNIDQATFQNNVSNGTVPISLAFKASSPRVNAAYSSDDKTIAIAFWTAGTYSTPWKSTTITADKPCVALLHQTGTNTYRLTVADPTQALTTAINLTVKIGTASRSTAVTLSTGSDSGKGVVKTLTF